MKVFSFSSEEFLVRYLFIDLFTHAKGYRKSFPNFLSIVLSRRRSYPSEYGGKVKLGA